MEGACGSLWYRKNTTINKHTGITYFKIMLHFLVGNIFFCKISYQTSMKSLKVCRNSSSFHGRDVHGCITYASVQNKSHSPPPDSSSLAFASLWGSPGSTVFLKSCPHPTAEGSKAYILTTEISLLGIFSLRANNFKELCYWRLKLIKLSLWSEDYKELVKNKICIY